MLGIPHCLDNRLADGGKFLSLTHRLRSTAQKHYFSASDTHFCYRLNKPQGLVQLEVLGNLREFIHLIGSRTRELPARSIVPEPLRDNVQNCDSYNHRHKPADLIEFGELTG
jgi:hypothetical protein